MTENFDRFPNQSKPPAATMQDETAADDKISTYSNAKNFTSETNNDENCNCWVCEAQKSKIKNVKRENSLLGNIVTFLK